MEYSSVKGPGTTPVTKMPSQDDTCMWAPEASAKHVRAKRSEREYILRSRRQGQFLHQVPWFLCGSTPPTPYCGPRSLTLLPMNSAPRVCSSGISARRCEGVGDERGKQGEAKRGE